MRDRVPRFAAGGLAGDLCQEEAPDVVIAGSPFDGQPIDRCLDELVHFGCRALIVSYDPSPSRMIGALGHGASGYLLSDSRTEDVATAAAVVAAGGVALHPVAAGLVVHQWRRYRAGPCVPDPTQRSLTPREQEILTAMVDGLAAKSIARMLGVSLKTVENHKTRIFAKLGARTQAHAVSIATAEGVTCARLDSDGPDSAHSSAARSRATRAPGSPRSRSTPADASRDGV